MKILYGVSGSGKTKYFRSLFPDAEILHASDVLEMKTTLESPFHEKPFLLNIWYDVDLRDVIPYKGLDVFIELHYFEDRYGVVEVKSEGRFKGFKNLNLARKAGIEVIHFPGVSKRIGRTKDEYYALFGSIFPYIEDFLN